MSDAPGFFIPDKARRRSLACHRKNDSGELDVFEAESYFSTTTENPPLTTTKVTLPHKIGIVSTRKLESYNTTSSRQLGNWRQGRASLDMPRFTKHSQPQNILLDQPIKPNTEKKKHKQPSSPGGKLANFFNSLINQTVSKKKKSTKSGSQSVKDIAEEDSPSGWRRRQRSSISHFTTTTNSSSSTTATATTKTTMSEIDSNSIKSCPGFRTPPPYMINTPIKPYKEFKTAFSKYSNSSATTPKPTSRKGNLDWLDEKFKIVNGLSSETHSSSRDFREAELESRKLKIFLEEDGDESDSSSDLFELQLNSDPNRHRLLGYCASDLPVYESTHMDTIKISSTTPITNGPFRN